MTKFSLILLTLSCITTTGVQGASFDCAKATTAIEKRICSHKLLSYADEQYSNLYKFVRSQTKENQALHSRVKSTAITALKQREALCANQTHWSCLREWYGEGRDRLAQQLWEVRPELIQTTLTPRLVFERLNLHTLVL